MKKLMTFFIAIVIGSISINAQPVSHQAVIPMAVSLNSILRLNVTSGGNIEFAFNTITDYTSGVGPGAKYQTGFTVASSVDFLVNLRAEDASFIGTDDPANTLALDNCGYYVDVTGSGAWTTNYTTNAEQGGGGDPAILTGADVAIVTSVDGAGAGDITKNAFQINWEFGTSNGTNMNGSSIMAQSVDADRYTTNVFLTLVPDYN